ncbi:MAG: hypothetical protein CMP61_02250 [Flavobacteriales bacterium]|nr:hypothetical protein [Flavobacteriales bacterium]|tara:strand:- start:7677 stop:9566 length:1890 start_codon:yes stop_codon:yes gene_type:complete
MTKRLLFLFLSVSIVSFSQSDPIPKKLLEAFPETYRSLLQHDIDEKYLENYALDNANGKYNLTYFHNAYYDQPVLVSYVRSILDKLDPGKTDQLDVFITRSTAFNAFTIVDGSVFVNISALAEMSSEAELAFLLGHEYAHYLEGHARKGYLKNREAGLHINRIQAKENMTFSQKNEFEADSLGFVLACKAGYDPRAMDILTQRLIFLQKKSYISLGGAYNKSSVMPTTHPVGEDRLRKIKMLEYNGTGELYPSGKERFENIKRFAEFEFLKLLDESFDIHTMITFPLKKFLITGDDVYLPTLVRGIRKALLVVPELKKEGFMTTHFQQRETMFKKRENLIHHLYYEFPDSAEINIMHQTAAINFKKVPFYSFDQAFKYFINRAVKAGYEEPLLDKVLHYGVKSAPGRTALNQYLKNKNNLYYDYAEALKYGKVNENLEKGEDVVLLGGFHKTVFKKNWIYSNAVEEFKGRHEFLSDLREKYKSKGQAFKLYNYEDFIQKNELGRYLPIVERLIYAGRYKDLFKFDPRIYYAFRSANVKSLEYLKVDYYNIRRRWRNWGFMAFPPIGILFLLEFTPAFSPYLSVSNYYQIRFEDGEWLGGIDSDLKYMPMSRRRALNIMYKTHKKYRRVQ